MYTEQIEKGQKYDVLNKCVSISILDFILFENSTGFYSRFHILEDSQHFIYTDKMEFHVIELPKLPKEWTEDCSNVELWAKFINAEKREEFDMIAEKDPYIKSAYDQLQIISRDKQKRFEYEAREKAIRDHHQFLSEAERRGIEIGEKQGIEQGILGAIAICREIGLSEIDISKKLQEKYRISSETADTYLKTSLASK